MAKNLRREKTNASGKQAAITFNTPGIYYPKYGKIKVTVGGRGATGNSPTGGNFAGYYNPGSGGNYAYTNPTYKWGNSFTDYTDATYGVHDYSNNDHPWGPSITQPSPYSYTANGAYPGYSVVNYNVDGTTPGNVVYNPYTPGNAVYNPYTPGNAGTPANILGVAFPGGAAGSLAPTVPDTSVKVPWAGAGNGVSITVPAGGTVVIKEV
jgi:hypothetical protein